MPKRKLIRGACMNRQELKEKLKKEGLLSVYRDGELYRYVDEAAVIQDGKWKNAVQVYGIFKGNEQYNVFFTDGERGIPAYRRDFNSEEEACDCLYEKLLRQVDIHQRYVLRYLRDYLIDDMKYSEKLADATCEDFKKNFDIAEELWITLDCKDFPAPGYCITVRGYSAEELYSNYKLNVLGAYNYLIFLREEPMRALELLKKGLPRK